MQPLCYSRLIHCFIEVTNSCLGGIFHDCLIHDLDIGRWIVGENPETIYVVGE